MLEVVNTLPFGPSSSTVGCTARYGMAVIVHFRVSVSPAVTVEFTGEIVRTGSARSGGSEY